MEKNLNQQCLEKEDPLEERQQSSGIYGLCLPKIAETRDVVFLDGIYLSRKACVLICCDEKHVLGWYLCRYEHAGAWIALMKRIAEPRMVVSDGGTGFAKALKKAWPKAKHQRCVFHVFCQVKRYITSRPNTAAGSRTLYAGQRSTENQK